MSQLKIENYKLQQRYFKRKKKKRMSRGPVVGETFHQFVF